jgi:hypothetical protein
MRRARKRVVEVGDPEDVEVPTRGKDSYLEVGVARRGMGSYLREVRVPTRIEGSYLREVRVPTRVEGSYLREVSVPMRVEGFYES